MARSAFCFLSIVIGAALIFHPGHLWGDEKPEIQIFLKFPREAYAFDAPIEAKVAINNKSGKNLLLSKGFSKRNLFLEMRIIDPAGRLIIARHTGPHNEFPDAPPLPFVLHDKKPVRAVPCEAIKAGAKWIMKSEDIRDYYRLERPGKYTAQIQVSLAAFEGEPCHTKNYRWLGVVKSNTVEFYIKPVDKDKKTARLPPARRHLKQMEIIANDKAALQHAADVPLKRVAYHLTEPASFDLNGAAHLASSQPMSLTASYQNPFIIQLTGGGGLPTADMTFPAQTVDVPVNTSIEVNVSDADRKKVVKMNVLGTEVYSTLASDPATAYPHTERIPPDDSSNFILSYQDPQTDFANCQQVDVVVKTYRQSRPNNQNTYNFNFETICVSANDADDDGISDETEKEVLHTNKEMKTLFVRPKTIEGYQYVYWYGFRNLYPGSPAGFADIPAFKDAGIEISVIGDAGHPYAPMRDFGYDPANDPNQPACDILEVFYLPRYNSQGDGIYCTYGHHNYGHTYFYDQGATWYWDTKGYVPNDQTSSHYQKYQYFTPLIYPFPLDRYFAEGAYSRILANENPNQTTDCGLNQCYDTHFSSPLNLNSSDPVQGHPDATVEFNEITFNSADKKINFVGTSGTPYDRNQVLRRTIVHEIGHALLAASEYDHCNDPQCIMFGGVEDWEPWGFGPPSSTNRICTHSPDQLKDIRAPGVIHNRIH